MEPRFYVPAVRSAAVDGTLPLVTPSVRRLLLRSLAMLFCTLAVRWLSFIPLEREFDILVSDLVSLRRERPKRTGLLSSWTGNNPLILMG